MTATNEATPVSSGKSDHSMKATLNMDSLKFARTNNRSSVLFLRHIDDAPSYSPDCGCSGRGGSRKRCW